MIDGPCLGGGCLVAAACDLRYASQLAIFSVPVARLGIVLDQSNVLRLAGLIGPAWTKELIYSAATIDSITAQSIGLINDYFDDKDQLLEFVTNKAKVIAGHSSNFYSGREVNHRQSLRTKPGSARSPARPNHAGSRCQL